MSRPSVTAAASVAAGLVGGFAAARYTGHRELGGAVFVAFGALAARSVWPIAGAARTAALGVLYAAALGGSHPLAHEIGPWPSVLAVTAVASGATYVVAEARTAAHR